MIKKYYPCLLALIFFSFLVSCGPQQKQTAISVAAQKGQALDAELTTTDDALNSLVTALPDGKFLAFTELRDINGSISPLSTAVFHSLESKVLRTCGQQNIQLIEREAMQLILDEWKLEMSGLTGSDKGAKELLGADLILTGKVATEGELAHIYLKALDLSNGAVLAATEAWQPLPTGINLQAKETVKEGTISNQATSDDGNLKLWTEAKEYAFGENLAVYFEVTQPSYVTLIDITPDGEKTVIFPNAAMRDNFSRPGTTYRIPPIDSPLQIEVTGPAGKDRIIAFTSDKPGLDSRIVQTRGIKFTSKLVATTQSRAAISIDIKEK